jgi:hypothetical protein
MVQIIAKCNEVRGYCQDIIPFEPPAKPYSGGTNTNEINNVTSRKIPLTLPSPLWGEDKVRGKAVTNLNAFELVWLSVFSERPAGAHAEVMGDVAELSIHRPASRPARGQVLRLDIPQ